MNGLWRPGIVDPSFVGWFTVFSYYTCAGLSLAFLLKARRCLDGAERRFAVVMTCLLLGLGLIKNLDLFSLVSGIGRLIAEKRGWIESRRAFQAGLMLLVVVGFVVLFTRAVKQEAFARIRRERAPELACLVYLCLFVLLRGISLHQLGALLSFEVFGVRLNWIAELGGLGTLALILLARLFGKGARIENPPGKGA